MIEPEDIDGQRIHDLLAVAVDALTEEDRAERVARIEAGLALPGVSMDVEPGGWWRFWWGGRVLSRMPLLAFVTRKGASWN